MSAYERNPTLQHFVAYHSVKQMGRAMESDGELSFLSRKHGLLRKAIGNTVWIIQGSSEKRERTTYALRGAYIADSLEEVSEEPGLFIIRGSTGTDFRPPIGLNNLEWFPSLQKTQSNFSLGFNRISDPEVVSALVALRGAQSAEIPNEGLQDIDLNGMAIEGAPRLVTHLRRERSRYLIEAKKAAVLSADHTLKCQACQFDFSHKYGSWGDGFCEIHHIIPLATSDSSTPTRLEDLAVLCSNCHRIVHRVDPMPSIESLTERIRREGNA